MKKVELTKAQKLVCLVGGALVLMIVQHFFMYSKTGKTIQQKKNEFNQVKGEYTSVKGKQKPANILNKYVEEKDKIIAEATNSLQYLLLLDAPENEAEGKEGEAKPATRNKVKVGFEPVLSASSDPVDIYKNYMGKLLKVKAQVEKDQKTKINIFEKWGVEEEIERFDENTFPDILNNLRIEYQVIGREGVNESVKKSSKRKAVRLRKDLGLNMRKISEKSSGPYKSLIQKMMYVHFLEEKLPSNISLGDLIKYMDIEYPDDKDGGLIVGMQAALEYVVYLSELSSQIGLESFDSFDFKNIDFEGEQAAVAAPVAGMMGMMGMMGPGMGPGMDPRMMGPGMMGPGMMGPGGQQGQQGQPAEEVEEESPWDTAKALKVEFSIVFSAENLEGIKFLATLVQSRGFFHLDTINIKQTEESGVLSFRANLHSYCWININKMGG